MPGARNIGIGVYRHAAGIYHRRPNWHAPLLLLAKNRDASGRRGDSEPDRDRRRVWGREEKKGCIPDGRVISITLVDLFYNMFNWPSAVRNLIS